MSAKPAPSAQSEPSKPARKAQETRTKVGTRKPAKAFRPPVAKLSISTQTIDISDAPDLFADKQKPIPGGDDDWRIEKRERVRKTDNVTVTYWNFRARKGSNIDGKRVVPYRKGGSYEQR